MSEQTEEKSPKGSKGKGSKKSNGAVEQGEYRLFPYDAILARDEDNARTVIDDGYIKELAASIAQHGLLEPIGLNVVSGKSISDEDKTVLGLEEDDDEPELVGAIRYGFQRYYAIQLLKEQNPKRFGELFKGGVPAMCVDKADKVRSAFDNLIENIGRKDLSPADLAAAFYKLRYDENMSTQEIADRVPFSKGYVQGLIKLKKDLISEAWDAFHEGKITYDVAREIMGAGGEEEQQKALKVALKAAEKTEGKKTKRGQRAAVREASGSAKPSVKELRSKLESFDSESPTNYQQGVINTLRFVLGESKRLPAKPKK